MKLKILGCDGGRGLGYNSTALLMNDSVLIDAGTIQSVMSLDEALRITDIFFTHTHLDHVIDLPFLLDATFNQRDEPLRIHGLEESLEPMMAHLFNNQIWPDFSRLPTPDAGQFTLMPLKPGQQVEAGGLKVTPIAVNHTVPTVGYKIEDAESCIIFSGDTGPCDALWEAANSADNLKAVILDVSFPNSEQPIADISKHMTPADLAAELKKLQHDCYVYAFHFKVGSGTVLEGQISRITHAGQPVRALRRMQEIQF